MIYDSKPPTKRKEKMKRIVIRNKIQTSLIITNCIRFRISEGTFCWRTI